GFSEYYGKKNLRQLSTSEQNEAENIKMGVLLGWEPLTDLTLENLQKSIAKNVSGAEINKSLENLFIENFSRSATLPELRELQKNYYINREELKYEQNSN